MISPALSSVGLGHVGDERINNPMEKECFWKSQSTCFGEGLDKQRINGRRLYYPILKVRL